MRNGERLLRGVILLGIVTACLSGCASLLGPREAAYVQTPGGVVEAMLSLAGVTPADYVVDLGSGDGRIPIAAARRHGARALGIERDPALVEQSRANAAREGVAGRVEFRTEDIFQADFSAATVVTLYLLPEINMRLRPRILSGLRPGTRIVSHDFDMGEWEPDRYVLVEAADKPGGMKESRLYLWTVPARADGEWRGTLARAEGEEAVSLTLQQRFQTATAMASLRGTTWQGGGRISGEVLSLTLRSAAPRAETLRLSLRVGEGRMEGDALGADRPARLRLSRIGP